MTREEAKGNLIHAIRWNDMPKKEALEIAIKALEQEPCEDAISRQAVIDALTKTSGIRGDALKALYDLPPVNPQPKTGHWILTSDDDYEYCTCSECGYQNGENWMIGSQIKYCPNCGRSMIEPQESEKAT